MSRSAILSNGRLAVGLDERGFVHDFYYPYVGLNNVTSARSVKHKMGIWVDGDFSWLDSSQWSGTTTLDEHSLMSHTLFVSDKYGISIHMRDFVDNEQDVFGRVVIVENRFNKVRDVRLFFGQIFQISRNGRADTALYTMGRHPYILTYNRHTSFVAGLRTMDGAPFDQFAVGNYALEGKAGTYLDAEDGELSGNPVEHGGVDSIIRSSFTLNPKGSYHLDYWVAASEKGYSRASRVHRNISTNGLYPYLNSTVAHWKNWLSRSDPFVNKLDVKYQSLARKSLLTIKAHCDDRGGVIASADSGIYNYGRDYYSYVWPRDAMYALSPLLGLGYSEEVKKFLEFMIPLIHPRGYAHHKYSPDSAPGSTWHPLVQNGKAELNIQEDETASIVRLAIDYIETTSDEKFHEKLIKKVIIPCCEFMTSYMDASTGLPHASYDLWEQLFLTNAYTTSIVYSTLVRAKALLEQKQYGHDTSQWQQVADTIAQNIGKLFDEKSQWFVRGLHPEFQGHKQERVLDIASLFGMSEYGPLKPDDTAVYATMRAIEENNIVGGGVIRYRGDDYMKTSPHVTANPWHVCTLWLGRHYLNTGDRDGAIKMLDWSLEHTPSNGIMSEQIDPETSEPRGVSPLVWSHAEYLSLLQKLFKN